MASSLLVRAKQTLERNKSRIVKAAKENEKVTALAAGGAAGVGVTVAAAFADQKMGEGKQWKVFKSADGSGGVPVVGIVGAAALVPAFFTNKMPIAQAVSISAGMAGLNIAVYRYLVEETIAPGTGG
jgi:hypothetical protein